MKPPSRESKRPIAYFRAILATYPCWMIHSVHLIVTSPPYWTLKKYRDHSSQLGAVHDYDVFLQQLDEVWRHCFRVLVPGGRLVCVVGDTTLIKVPPPDLRDINEYSRGEHHAEVEDDPIGESSDEELKGFCRLVLELTRGM